MPGIRCQICSWEVCGVGVVFLEGGFAEGGFGRTPRTPWLRACSYVNISVSITACNVLHIRI